MSSNILFMSICRCVLQVLAKPLLPALLFAASLIPFADRATAQTSNQLRVSAALGSRGTSTNVNNLNGESVARFEQSLHLVFGEIAYQKSENVKLWARYANGFNPGNYVFAGLNRAQSSLYLGGQVRMRSYVASVQYGYQSLQDSVYRDVLWTEHTYQLSNGLTPTLTTWVGVGNQIGVEWMLRGGVILPLQQHLALEPVLMFLNEGIQERDRSFFGVNTHFSMLEKGKLTLGVSRQINPGPGDAGLAFLGSGSVPFIHRHQINFSVQRNTIGNVRSTLFAVGVTLGLI